MWTHWRWVILWIILYKCSIIQTLEGLNISPSHVLCQWKRLVSIYPSEATFDSAREPKIASFDTELTPHYQATLPRPNDSIRALSGGLAWLARFRQCRDGQERPGRLKPVLNWKKTLASRPIFRRCGKYYSDGRSKSYRQISNPLSMNEQKTMIFFFNHPPMVWSRGIFMC